MKKIILLFSILVFLLVTSGCLYEMIGQKITVQKQTGEENIFEEFREVTSKKQVKKAINIIKNAKWENEKVEMGRHADYRFQFPSKNRNDKIASYLLWISPEGQNLEIVTENYEYVKLTKQDSAELFGILIGEESIK